jgi:hypothetical protein
MRTGPRGGCAGGGRLACDEDGEDDEPRGADEEAEALATTPVAGLAGVDVTDDADDAGDAGAAGGSGATTLTLTLALAPPEARGPESR